jgi:hypothetical protein
MTRRARRLNVSTCQLEIRLRMVERRGFPGRRLMASYAIRGEPRRVFWVRCVRVISLMAADALTWCSRVNPVDMARQARSRYVGSGQRETRFGMVKCCRTPGRCLVTACAISGEPW